MGVSEDRQNPLAARSRPRNTPSMDRTKTARPARQRREFYQLSMYADPPTEELTIDEFEDFAISRLHVLKTIETLTSRNVQEAELDRGIATALQKHSLALLALDKPEVKEMKYRKDQISHFILRIAYCQSEDLRRWFMAQEGHLFRYRYKQLSPDQQTDFIFENGIPCAEAREDELDEVERQFIRDSDFSGTVQKHFRVPFTQALDLVGKRQAIVKKGMAYISRNRLSSTILLRFRAQLSRSLAETYKCFPLVKRDERLAPLLKNLSKQYLGPDYSGLKKFSGEDVLTAKDVHDVAKTNFPLCMRNMHDNLLRNHKLKHTGRLQYSLFLKGAGLPLEEALAFWQHEFTKIMSVEDFNKSYRYNFRFNYGQEGKRANYTPYPCMKIIMGPPPHNGEVHGCPFRNFAKDNLAASLAKMKISRNDVGRIVDYAERRDYQVACRTHFETLHPGAPSDDVANHPNKWYEASRNYHKEKAGKSSTTGTENPAKQSFAAAA